MQKHARAPFIAAAMVVFFVAILLLCIRIDWRISAQTSQQLTGHESHLIALTDASKLTSNFRASAGAGAVLGESFSRDAVQSILNQPNCVGVRVYYGRKSDGSPVLVLVGVDASIHDLTAGVILETGFPCPPFCDGSSPLYR
jgi:hypothetical protein